MKKILLLVIILLLSSASLPAQPKIQIVGGETFDFGEMYKGDNVERKVTIKNIGTQTLVIDRVHASCGCTAALLAEKTVPPGKTTSLSIGFDSKNFYGDVHKTVTVFSNDPNNASTEIKFKAFIKEALAATPPYIYFTPGKVDSAMTASATLKNMSDDSITIRSITTDFSEVKFDLKKNRLAPGEIIQLSVTFTPSKVGYVNKDVVIKTSHPRQPELTMKLVCNVLRNK